MNKEEEHEYEAARDAKGSVSCLDDELGVRMV